MIIITIIIIITITIIIMIFIAIINLEHFLGWHFFQVFELPGFQDWDLMSYSSYPLSQLGSFERKPTMHTRWCPIVS